MALPEVGLKAVIENLSKFLEGASSIDKAYVKLDSGASGVAKSSAQMGNSLLHLGGIAGGAALAGVTALAAGIAGFAVSGIVQAKDLDQQMANIAATMGKTKEQVGPLKDLILDLSLDPGLTVNATQAAEAIELLAANGLSATQIMQGAARSTVAMANATGADFGTAANIATGAMQAFNLEAQDLETVADGITGVLVSSKFSAEDYAGAIAQAGAVVGASGVSLQDFNTVLAASASSFASGSDAGTSFKTLIQKLVNPTDEAKALMQQLGINVFDSSGNMRDMTDIVFDLNSAFNRQTEQQRANTAAIIGGADASRIFLALSKMTSAEFDELSLSVNKSGQATKAAATRVDSLSGALEILQGIIQGIQIQIGDLFLPILQDVTGVLAGLATSNAPAIVGFFDGLIAKGQELFAAFSKFGAGGLFAALGFESSALFFKKLSELFTLIIGDSGNLADTLQTTLGNAFAFLAANVFPILTQAIKFIIANFNEFKGAIIGVGAVMGGAIFAALVAALFSLLTPINLIIAGAALLGAAWAGNWGGIQEKTFAVWAVLQPILSQLMAWLGVQIPIAIAFLANTWTNILLPAIVTITEFLVGTAFPIWLQLQGVLLAVADVLSAVLGVAITAVAGYLQNIFLPAIMLVWSGLSETFGPALTVIGDYLSSVFNPMLGESGGAFAFISEKLSQATSLFTGWANAIKAFQLPEQLVRHSPSPLEETLAGVASILSGPLQNAFNVFGKVAQTPLKVVAASSGQIVVNFRELVQLIAVIVEVWQPATDAMIANFQALASAGTVASTMIRVGFASVGSLLNVTGSQAAALATNIRSIGTSASSATNSLISMTNIKFEGLIENMSEIESASENVQEAFADARNAAQQFNSTSMSMMAGALNGINKTLQEIVQNFENAADASSNSGLGGKSGMVSGPTAGSGRASSSIVNNFFNNFGGNTISNGLDESQFDAMVLASLQRLTR